jgi:hypothetical protein
MIGALADARAFWWMQRLRLAFEEYLRELAAQD